jgi:RNA ligase (TIGR02306 family)
MRKLASIQFVDEIRPIPDADSIECAVIGGWTVVTRKGEFRNFDRCIFFEIDSVLPVKPEFEHLRKSSYIKNAEYEGFRLRTVKLRKQLSQGLIIKVPVEFNDMPVGTDLTEAMGIIKYEPSIPTQMSGNAEGRFPSFIPKTDQERLQNLSYELKVWVESGDEWEVTEKLEGSSMTVFFNDDKFGVCSRNWELKEDPNNSLWKLARELDIENLLVRAGYFRVALQGELIGPGVQGNHYGLTKTEFRVFDVYDIANQRYMTSEERFELLSRIGLLGYNHVPVLDKNFDLAGQTMQSMLDRADGPSQLNSKVLREGLVYKNITNPGISFKTVSNQYLLKEK